MPATKIPHVPVAAPTMFNLIRPSPGEVMSGFYDVEAKLTSSSRHRSVRLYVDGEPLGDAPMFNLTRGRYTQLVDTARLENGKHEFAVAALDERGEILFTRVREVEVQGQYNLEMMGVHPLEDRGGYQLTFKLFVNRCELPKERYQIVSWFSATERVPLEPSLVEYWWSNNETPTVRLEARLPAGMALPTKEHRVWMGIRDNAGTIFAASTERADGR